MDCKAVMEGKLMYAMKETRRIEAVQAIREILDQGSVTPCMLPSILGRLLFADGQLSGRAGKLAMADIRTMGLESKERRTLTSDAAEALSCCVLGSLITSPKHCGCTLPQTRL